MGENERSFKDGKYTGAVITDAAVKVSKENTPYVELAFQVTEHTDFAGVKSVVMGKTTAYVKMFLSDKAVASSVSVDQRAVLGFQNHIDFFDAVVDKTIIGKTADLKCSGNEYNGKVTDSWSIMTPSGGGGKISEKGNASPDDIKKFRALLGGKPKVSDAPPVVLPDGVQF